MTTFTVRLDDRKAEALRAEAARRGITAEELVRQATERELPPKKRTATDRRKGTVAAFKSLIAPGTPKPSDQQIERWLDERRMRKLG